MEDIEFSYLDNGTIKQTKFRDISANRRVLICSLTRPYDNIADLYIQHVHSKVDILKTLGVDEVYFINFVAGKMLLHSYHVRQDVTITLLYNDDKTFISHLRQLANINNRDIEFLSAYWNFQALFDNGKLVNLEYSSIDNPVKDAVLTHPTFMKEKGLHLLNSDLNLTIWIPSLLFFSRSLRLTKLIFYNRIWPNESLDKYLLDNKYITSYN